MNVNVLFLELSLPFLISIVKSVADDDCDYNVMQSPLLDMVKRTHYEPLMFHHETVTSDDVTFRLFTKSNPINFQILKHDAGNIRETYFDASKRTVIFLMGFAESVDGGSNVAMKKAYLKSYDYNYIAVDWAKLIKFPNYVRARNNAFLMSEWLADFIRSLKKKGVTPYNIHIIGFSIGAQVAGLTGKNLKQNGIHVRRITGLDPAKIGFKHDHIYKGDARFVDIIHTNPRVYGMKKPVGDVDFYPNDESTHQPGCTVLESIFDLTLPNICDHGRAWEYYVESVQNPKGFPATHCRDWKSGICRFKIDGYMGFSASPKMSGVMYLNTNKKPPYARNGP